MMKTGGRLSRALGKQPSGRWGLPQRDSAVASVCWEGDVLCDIVLVRRSDGALAFVDVPEELVGVLERLNVPAVVEHAQVLRAVVMEALPVVTFLFDAAIGEVPVRDGAAPAALGLLRHFKPGAFGVDIGEFELLSPLWVM